MQQHKERTRTTEYEDKASTGLSSSNHKVPTLIPDAESKAKAWHLMILGCVK